MADDQDIPPQLVCPDCKQELRITKNGATCNECGAEYSRSDNGQLDLRLNKQKTINLEYNIGGKAEPGDEVFCTSPPKPKFQAKKELGDSLPNDGRGTLRKIIQQIPPADGDAVCLEMGMRTKRLKHVCESAGYEYIAIDFDSVSADILGDGHALPLPDRSCDLVISHKVFEHLDNPFIVASEIERVLSDGGHVIGGVAFLEPFHGNSQFHHTHEGIYQVLTSAGFNVKAVYPGRDGLSALSEMGLFKKAPKPLVKTIILPVKLAHQIYYQYLTKHLRLAVSEA
jgi:SAM-dependent methyltransferase